MEKNMNVLVETLIRGRDSANRLQNLLHRTGNNDGSVSVDDLVVEISKSFEEGLSVLNSCYNPSVGLTSSSDQQSEAMTGNSEKTLLTPSGKESRGSYKKRKNVDSNVKVSATSEDEYVWRKYGEKEIINSKFPRCYYRCTYKDDQGCTALKQVQQLEGKSKKFHIKYFGCHTCTPTPQQHPAAIGSGVLLDFKAFKNNRHLAGKPSTTKPTPTKKQKVQSNKVKSAPNDARPDPILVSDEIFGYEFSPCFGPPLPDYGEFSSPTNISKGFLETNWFGNDEIFFGDHTMITIESLWD